jgi:nucleotide-binding universal stress UspA family protein
MFRRLLVAFDGSPHAQQALTEAIDLAQANRGTLTVMSVAPEPSVWAMSGYGVPIDVDGVSQEMNASTNPCSMALWRACPPTYPSGRS